MKKLTFTVLIIAACNNDPPIVPNGTGWECMSDESCGRSCQLAVNFCATRPTAWCFTAYVPGEPHTECYVSQTVCENRASPYTRLYEHVTYCSEER